MPRCPLLYGFWNRPGFIVKIYSAFNSANKKVFHDQHSAALEKSRQNVLFFFFTKNLLKEMSEKHQKGAHSIGN
jgi:hypothetical protein